MDSKDNNWPQKTKIIDDKYEIENIINKIKGYNKVKYYFTPKYNFSCAARGIRHEFVMETFKKFHLIKYIEEEILKFGDTGYDLYYEIKRDFHHLVIGVALNKKTGNLDFIHVYNFLRNLQKHIKIKKKIRF